jgi:hypothetical protein
MEELAMKARLAILPCKPGIASLLRAARAWYFSLLFRAGSEQLKALDGQGFQSSWKAHSPCYCKNLAASSEWRRVDRSEFKPAARPQPRRAGNAEREPERELDFAREGASRFSWVQADRRDLRKPDALVECDLRWRKRVGFEPTIRFPEYSIHPSMSVSDDASPMT